MLVSDLRGWANFDVKKQTTITINFTKRCSLSLWIKKREQASVCFKNKKPTSDVFFFDKICIKYKRIIVEGIKELESRGVNSTSSKSSPQKKKIVIQK